MSEEEKSASSYLPHSDGLDEKYEQIIQLYSPTAPSWVSAHPPGCIGVGGETGGDGGDGGASPPPHAQHMSKEEKSASS